MHNNKKLIFLLIILSCINIATYAMDDNNDNPHSPENEMKKRAKNGQWAAAQYNRKKRQGKPIDIRNCNTKPRKSRNR